MHLGSHFLCRTLKVSQFAWRNYYNSQNWCYDGEFMKYHTYHDVGSAKLLMNHSPNTGGCLQSIISVNSLSNYSTESSMYLTWEGARSKRLLSWS